MKTFFKGVVFAIAALLLAAGSAYGYIYFVSERELAREFSVRDDTRLVLPNDEASLAEGKRIATLAGCLDCHGDDFAGRVVDDIPHLVRIVAPNVSTALPTYSDGQLATLLRQGVKRDGHGALLMPSEMFRFLADEDLARLIAWLRTVPPKADGVEEKTELRVLGRFLVAKGDFSVAAGNIEKLPAAERGYDPADPASHGRYLVMNFCSECHGQDLQGFEAIGAPALTVAKAYSLENFLRLMREGIAQGESRELRIMGPTSRARFAHFTEEEVRLVHAYLGTL